MEKVYKHVGYTVCELNGDINSISKGNTVIGQADTVESKGTNLVPAGVKGTVIALRLPLSKLVGEHFVWVAFQSINRTAHMRFDDLIAHGR